MEIVRFPFFILVINYHKIILWVKILKFKISMKKKENTKEYEFSKKKMTDIKISVGSVVFSNKNFNIIAGPCSIESEDHIFELAHDIKKAGAGILRGGAFKLRTSPYDFQGLGKVALKYLVSAGKKENLPTVSEIIDVRHIDYYSDLDMIQVGARNMKNYTLLRELGRGNIPVLLKRGMDSTYEELLFAAEYIMSEGNSNVILCERGIRTFENYTRNTLDISAVPALKNFTNLPIIVDPSHSTGRSDLVESVSLGAAAAGANGLIIEVHKNPSKALSDKEQAVTPSELSNIVEKSKKIIEVLG